MADQQKRPRGHQVEEPARGGSMMFGIALAVIYGIVAVPLHLVTALGAGMTSMDDGRFPLEYVFVAIALVLPAVVPAIIVGKSGGGTPRAIRVRGIITFVICAGLPVLFVWGR